MADTKSKSQRINVNPSENNGEKMARKQKKVTPLDRGPIEKFQHGDYVEEETIVAGVTQLRNTTIDPISTYLRRGSINQKQFEAADNFAHKFRQANLGAHYARMRFDDLPRVSPGFEAAEVMENAKAHVYAALSFVGFPLARIIEHVAGHSCTAGTWDGVKESRRPEQDGMTALRLALDGLKKFYRL